MYCTFILKWFGVLLSWPTTLFFLIFAGKLAAKGRSGCPKVIKFVPGKPLGWLLQIISLFCLDAIGRISDHLLNS